MKDLLGDEQPDPPAMDAPLPWRVYALDDCDWWVARSLDEALQDYQTQTGIRPDGPEVEDAYELTDAELDSLKFTDCDEHERPTGDARTFREELARRVAEGLSAPEHFASTEY